MFNVLSHHCSRTLTTLDSRILCSHLCAGWSSKFAIIEFFGFFTPYWTASTGYILMKRCKDQWEYVLNTMRCSSIAQLSETNYNRIGYVMIERIPKRMFYGNFKSLKKKKKIDLWRNVIKSEVSINRCKVLTKSS